MSGVSAEYLRHVVERLESFGSHPLGFRVAGTPEEREATAFIASEMRDAGLVDVVEEPVPVDALAARGRVRRAGRRCALRMRVVRRCSRDAARRHRRGARRRRPRRPAAARPARRRREGRARPLGSRAALAISRRPGARPARRCRNDRDVSARWPVLPGARGPRDVRRHLACRSTALRHDPQRGRRSTRTACRDGGSCRSDGAADARRGGCQRRRNNCPGAETCRRRSSAVTMTAGSEPPSTTRARSRSRLRSRALSRRRAGRPSGRSSSSRTPRRSTGLQTRRTTGVTAPGTRSSRSTRSGQRIATFYLNIEGSGTPHPFTLDTPPELRRWIQQLCRRAARDGLLPHGFKLAAPTTWTEVWPFLAAGFPGINVSTFTAAFDRAEYHTQYDTSDRVDFDYLAGLAEVCARLLREADAGAADELDFAARARDVSRSLDGTQHRALTPALAELERATGRARFTAIGRGLHGLDARESARYPHEQTAADVARLEEAQEHLRAGKTGLAARSLARVGLNWLCADLGHEAFRIELARRGRDAPRATWAALGDPDVGPDLWDELASLRGERGARPARALARGSALRSTWRPRGPSSNDASSAWPRLRPGGSSPCPRSERRICLHESSHPLRSSAAGRRHDRSRCACEPVRRALGDPARRRVVGGAGLQGQARRRRLRP